MRTPLNLVVIGLTLSSSWGNGHATTYRSLLRGAAREGHDVLFLEREVPWYAAHRDLPNPDFCRLAWYESIDELTERYGAAIKAADAVIIGSYVPEGVEVIDAVAALSPRLLCFYDIDTPVTLGKLDRGDEEYLARRQISGFDIYFSFSGGQVIRTLEDRYGARCAVPLYCSVDPGRYGPTGEKLEWDFGYLGTYSPDRQPTLDRLLLEPARRLPDWRFVVAGPSYPAGIDWPDNVERIEHLPPVEHASFYSRQAFTLNVTRADMVAAGWSPSVRLFEAAACRAPIISDYWRGLDELLEEGRSILIARTSEDVVAALTSIGPEERQRIADSAYEVVAGSHTGEARARELADAIRSRLTAPANSPAEPRGAGAFKETAL